MLFSVQDYINDACPSTLGEKEFTEDCENVQKNTEHEPTHQFRIDMEETNHCLCLLYQTIVYVFYIKVT